MGECLRPLVGQCHIQNLNFTCFEDQYLSTTRMRGCVSVWGRRLARAIVAVANLNFTPVEKLRRPMLIHHQNGEVGWVFEGVGWPVPWCRWQWRARWLPGSRRPPPSLPPKPLLPAPASSQSTHNGWARGESTDNNQQPSLPTPRTTKSNHPPTKLRVSRARNNNTIKQKLRHNETQKNSCMNLKLFVISVDEDWNKGESWFSRSEESEISVTERMQERSIRPRQSHGGAGGGGGRRKGTIFHPTLGYPIQPPMPVTVQRR